MDDLPPKSHGAEAPSGGESAVRVRARGLRLKVTVVTKVLDPQPLIASQSPVIYQRRSSGKQMCLAMKEVRELNHLPNCSWASIRRDGRYRL